MGLFDYLLFTDNVFFVGIILLGGFILGLFFLVKGSDVFIDGVASIAKRHGISEHTIGLTLVAFATSLPELAVSAYASATSRSDIAVGNVVGSNVANICLVLGVSILIMKLKTSKDVRRNTGYMIGVTALLYLFILTSMRLTRLEGGIFLAIYALFLYHLFKYSEEVELEIDLERKELKAEEKKDVFFIVAGALGVTFGANLLVDSAVEMAHRVGISELIIGLTIVSVGTSLPELASSAMAAKKGKHGISIGNVIGSNIINIVLVLGLVALINPVDVKTEVSHVSMPMLMFLSVLMLIFVRKDLKKGLGIFLLAMYAVFMYLLI
ncbi:MAG TPA: calcium/sodium antiporter [Thermoplasmata archaeon]|nr:calcium/sodium antiporter [Thermoplasmata archaeon]